MSDNNEQNEAGSAKRIYVNLDPDIRRKIDALKALGDKSRDDVVSEGIKDLYKKVLHSLARDEGIVQDAPHVEIRREMFAESHIGDFEDICTSLGIRDAGVDSIVLEVKKYHCRK